MSAIETLSDISKIAWIYYIFIRGVVSATCGYKKVSIFCFNITLHPLVSIIDGREAKPLRFGRKLYNIYAVLLKDANCGSLKYGRSIYDYQQGTMLFLAPGQVMGSEDDGELHQPEGWVLVFHPEFLRGTPLASIMKDYSYFSYNANEALHLSEQERRTVLECMEKIKTELQYPINRLSKALIADNIKLFLDSCECFYSRQFITRENANIDILSRFETLLDEYLTPINPLSTECLPWIIARTNSACRPIT